MEIHDRRSFVRLLKFTLRTTGDDENDGTKGVTHAMSMQRLASDRRALVVK